MLSLQWDVENATLALPLYKIQLVTGKSVFAQISLVFLDLHAIDADVVLRVPEIRWSDYWRWVTNAERCIDTMELLVKSF
jgi:hypothetical protein